MSRVGKEPIAIPSAPVTSFGLSLPMLGGATHIYDLPGRAESVHVGGGEGLA